MVVAKLIFLAAEICISCTTEVGGLRSSLKFLSETYSNELVRYAIQAVQCNTTQFNGRNHVEYGSFSIEILLLARPSSVGEYKQSVENK